MKRLIIIIQLCCLSLSISAQNSGDCQTIIDEVKATLVSQGDSAAKVLLETKFDEFQQANSVNVYYALWGTITSRIWNANPTGNITKEYKVFLEEKIIPDMTDSFEMVPNAFNMMFTFVHDYALLKFAEKEYTVSEKYINVLLKWFERFPEQKETFNYVKCLQTFVGLETRFLSKYETAYPYAKLYVPLAKKTFGENDSQYVVALIDYYFCCNRLGNMGESRTVLQQCQDACKTCNNLSQDLHKMIQDLYDATFAIASGKTNIDTATICNDDMNFSQCAQYVVAGRGLEALPSLLKLREKALESGNIEPQYYIILAEYISNAYATSGDIVSANKIMEDCLNRVDMTKIPAAYASSFYCTLGYLAYQLKNYKNAITYNKYGLALQDKNDEFGLEGAKLLSNLGMTYLALKDNLRAKWYVDEAYSVCDEEIKNGSLNETCAMLLNNVGMVYCSIGDTLKAEKIFNDIVNNYQEGKGRDAWNLAANNLATINMFKFNYSKTIELMEQIKSVNSEYNNTLSQNLALCYIMTNNNKSKEALNTYNKQCYDNCLNVFNYFTQREREAYWNDYAINLTAINNFAAFRMPELTDIAYDNTLFTKNLAIHSYDVLKQFILSSNNQDLKKEYNIINTLRNNITYNSNNDSINVWTTLLSQKERKLLESYPGYKDDFMKSFGSWKDIKQILPPDETAVEFILVPKLKNWNEAEPYIGALVLNSKSNIPQIITLCSVDTLSNMVTSSSISKMGIFNLYQNTSKNGLYSMIWEKLTPYINGKTVYFAPTGILNSINHNAISISQDQTMGDKYNLIRLSSTNKISEYKKKMTALKSAAIYGGILYDESVADMTVNASPYNLGNTDTFLASRSEDERGKWNYLPGTREEATMIAETLTCEGIKNILYTEKSANEESFKKMSGASPDVIHLSTHGFYIKSTEQAQSNPFTKNLNEDSSKESELTKTGLLLAGANNVWTGRSKVEGIEDGVLTADEISRLDLDNTKLVVLSACETAKGFVDPIDGVLGLQRGFKKAGVQTIVMSLWKVSDTVTSLLMTEFYKNLSKGQESHQAMNNAANFVKAKYPDPYYWAAFVVLD